MIQVVVRSIPLLFGLCWAATAVPRETGPMAVVDSFQQRTAAVTAFTATVERVQVFRGARRTGRGTVFADRAGRCVYTYRVPGNYFFLASDTAVCGIDLEKKTGWTTGRAPVPLSLHEQIDPLFRFRKLATLDTHDLTFLGNSGNLMIFSMRLQDGKRRTAGFDASSFRCAITETFDTSGRVIEKTVFSYDNNPRACFPSRIVITEPSEGGISVDSVLFKRPRINGKIPVDAFDIPGGIRWRDDCDGTLPGRQFDTVPAP